MASETLPGSSDFPENRYRYNGKEFHSELGLGWYDYGFRWYDPVIARFVSVDPLAEGFYYLTTYQYASNSPIWMIDLDGLEGVPATENGGVVNTAQSSTFRPNLKPIKEPSAQEKAGIIKEWNPSFAKRFEMEVESGEATLIEEIAYNLLNGPTMAITEFFGKGKTLGGRSLTGLEKQDAAAEFSSLALSEVSKTLQTGAKLFETVLGFSKSKLRNAAQDKILTKGDIKLLKRAGLDPEELKGNKNTGEIDLFKTKDGEILIKPKNGKGPGEPTGFNLNELNEVY